MQGYRDLLLRPREQLVGLEAFEEANPIDRALARLAPQQCPPSSWKCRYEGARVLCVH